MSDNRGSAKSLLVVLLVLLGGLGVVWTQRQNIYDWSRLRDYSPSIGITQLATDTTMNDTARKIFYVQHPELNDRDAFNQHCQGFGEHTIVLGCYAPLQGIYLFDVQDPRLTGVEQVTAAHEMLHAAYDRLSNNDRKHIDVLTQQVFEQQTDERLKNTIEAYRQRDPAVVPNELHSIIGTEVRKLPQELEDYYSRYFANRAQIVGFADQYAGVITERRTQADNLELEINGLKNEIDQLEKTLQEQQDDLEHDRAGITTQSQANAFNARVAAYNSYIHQLNDLIARHNQLVDEYKANVVEQQELFKALDSRPTL